MNILVTAALAFFFAVGLGLAAAGGIRAAWRGLGRRRGVSAALAAFAVIATICAQKPGPSGPTITIDALLRDAGCYATNNVFHVAVTNAPAYAGIDFSGCPVLVYARERGQTAAADWFELTPRRTFSALPADYAIANATNYNYMVYLDYVPPSPVHTNGVFELHGFVIENEAQGEPDQLAAGFINSRAIPPPLTAHDYIQDGLIAMWDGRENAGWGVHGANAPIDLVGSADLTSVGNTIIEADNFTAGVGTYFKASVPTFATAVKNKNFTLQIIVKNSRVSNSAICGIGNRGVWLYGSSSYNVSTLNILTSSYTQTPRINFYSDAKFSISILGGAVPKIRLNDSEVQAIYGSQTNVSPTDLLLGALNGGFTGGSASFYSVRAYSRILTSEEIQHNYKIDKERFNLP